MNYCLIIVCFVVFFPQMLREGKQAYDENIHYPLLIILTKGPQPVNHAQ